MPIDAHQVWAAFLPGLVGRVRKFQTGSDLFRGVRGNALKRLGVSNAYRNEDVGIETSTIELGISIAV